MTSMDRKRFLAFIVDYSLLFVLNFIFFSSATLFAAKQETMLQSQYMILSLIVTNFFLCVYIPTKQDGSTIGKRIWNLHVVNTSKKPRTFWQSFLREWVLKFSLIIVLIPLNLVYSIFVSINERKFSFHYAHDIFLKTRVEYRR